MTIGTGDDAAAADILAIQTTAASALAAAGTALSNAATALSNSEEAQAVAAAASALAAVALSVPALGVVTSVGSSDKILIGQGSNTVAITVGNFNAALTTAIAAAAALSTAAQATATAAGTSAATALTNAATALAQAGAALTAAENAFDVTDLTVVTSVGSTDTVPIGQSGSTVAVAVATLLNAETIDLLTAAGAASDTDSFLTGQGTNVLTRQTLTAVWAWMQTHLPGYKFPVQEVTANLTVDGTYSGKILVVTGAGVTISPNFGLMGSGFECEIVTSGSGTVTWGGGVTATNGASGLPVSSYAKLLGYTSSAGNVVLAGVGTASGSGVAVPGSISGLTLGAVTSTTLAFTWTAPATGGAVTYYQPQYRVTGTGTWTAAAGVAGTSLTLVGLSASTEYDVQVAAGNSGGLSGWSATVNGMTSASALAAPGTPTALLAGTPTSASVPLSWTAPSSGGAVATYTVQYRVTSVGGSWIQVTGISGVNTTISGLTALTQYDFQVAAINAGGSSAFTATTNATTAAASSTTASWFAYLTALTAGSHANVYNLDVTAGTAPTTVAIGFSTSQSVAPSPMPAVADGLAGNFNGSYWGTYMNAPASAGTYYGWAIGYSSGGTPLFTIVGPAITVT